MQDNEKKPALRFKGFTDPWEQRKLGEIAKEVVRNDPASDAPIMMITAGNGFIEQSDRYAFNNAGESLKKYILLECGELAYNHGASKLRPYGSCFALTTVEKARIPFVYHCFSVEKSNPEFLSIELNGANVENQLRKIVSSGARMDGLLNIAYSEYTEVTVQLPKKEEQDWIAKFFKQLDTLITLHQRKYEKLVNIKKSMLDKMFPPNGASVPEIRFKGFTDPWEQRKLGELSRSFEYGLNAAAKEYDGQNKYLRITDIDDTSRQFVSADITSPDANLAEADNYRLSDGDVLFARTGASVGKTYLYKKSDGLVYFAGFLIRAKIKESVSAGFIFQNTLTRSYERYIAITSQRSGQPGVNAQEYAEYQLMLPELFEQEKIAKLLEALDTLITLHQRKLEKLQNIKKSCLEKMFV